MTTSASTIDPDSPLPRGLTAAEVEASRAEFGANVLTPPKRDPWWKLYLEKFEDPIIRILMVAAVIALLVGLYDGHFIEAIGIIVAIFLSTGLAFLNEYEAAKEFDILNQVSDETGVTVIREGEHRVVPKRDLVVGDIVLIERGDELPLDGELVESVSLSINESSLTGESKPVSKFPRGRAPAETGSVKAEHAYPLYTVLRGSTVSDGHGILRATAVGDATEIGHTARAAAEESESGTPLSRQLEKLAGVISVVAFSVAAIIFIAQTIRGVYTDEIYDLVEQGGRLVPVPLSAGQWYCFFLLAVVMLILCAQIWAPVKKAAMSYLGLEKYYPKCLDQEGVKGFYRLAATAAVVGVAGIALGLLVGAMRFSSGSWLPITALGAFLRYFMLAVTVIVVAVPEGLPMCVTLALAYSMKRMTKTNNLVRKMHACETIGAASVICSDKTGTLTMNQMRVSDANFPFLRGKKMPAGNGQTDVLAEAICANSTANLEHREDGQRVPIGNPTEGALLLWIEESGRVYDKIRHGFKIDKQLTFSTERKYMATSGVSGVTGKPILYAKGAAEILLARCGSMRKDDGSVAPLDMAAKEKVLFEAAEFQKRGMRIIGFASREVTGPLGDIEEEVNQGGLTWDGFIAIADPIRPDAAEAIGQALNAGIDVKIVTGDNQTTAKEIARQAGLWTAEDSTERSIITGDAFEVMSDEDASEAACRIKVMARARPLHKLRLVNLLQEKGEVVAVTGDGTNDAPALNHADVGLSMGMTGTSVAKEASDIILLDDSFKSIVNAVSWGRSLYANIQKFVVFQLTINVAAVGIALLGPFLGVTLPLTVVQMLWINLIMDTFAALALASEPPDWGLMKNEPRDAAAFIVTPRMWRNIAVTGGIFLGLFLLLQLGFSHRFPMNTTTPDGLHNLTLFFTGFVFLQFWNLFNARVFGSEHSAFYKIWQGKGFLLMATIILIGQILLVQFGGAMFRVVPLSVWEWIMLLVITSPVLWVGEFLRYDRRQREKPGYWKYSGAE